MIYRHNPTCFTDCHRDWQGNRCEPEDCAQGGDILIESRWVNNPFDSCNLSDFGNHCYAHGGSDCERLFWIWYREVKSEILA